MRTTTNTADKMPVWPGHAFFDTKVQKVMDKYSISTHWNPDNFRTASGKKLPEMERLEILAKPIIIFQDLNEMAQAGDHLTLYGKTFGWHYSWYNEFCAELLLELTRYHNRPIEKTKQHDAMVKVVMEFKDDKPDPEWALDQMRVVNKENVPASIITGEKWDAIAARIWDDYRIIVKGLNLKVRLWPYEVKRRNKIISKYEKNIRAWEKLSSIR